MKKLLQLTLLLAALAWCVPAHATWTNQISNSSTTCASGTACTKSVTLTSGWLVVVIANNDNSTITSCCGGAGCTWTQDKAQTAGSTRSVVVYHSTNCGGTVSIGPTWGGCAAGPNCTTDIIAWSSSTGSIAVNGTPAGCTTTTAWCTPASLTSANDVFVGVISTSGTTTACTGGSTATCIFSNGDGLGYISNVAGTSYSPPAWTGSSGTSAQAVVGYSEAAAASTFRTQVGGFLVGP